MQRRSWEHFEHDADIGLRASASSREGLFEAMAEALTALITDPGKVRAEESVSIRCEAPDDALLLTDWLNALIYEMATRGMLFGEWRVTFHDRVLEAVARGERVDRVRHEPVVEVKGATYTALSVSRDSAGTWHGQCIVDV
jgi:tRNA nucleotidyltransferase (CCA-adding enzyme)